MSIKYVNDSLLLSANNSQVMMAWEKPYMETSIDILQPKGDVLEIGFGLGYSASQIMKHKPKSYTIIECDPTIIKKFNDWREQYSDISICLIEGKWQNKLSTLGIFDEIYFDDYPIPPPPDDPNKKKWLSGERLPLFLSECIHKHARIGTKISWYMGSNKNTMFPKDISDFTTIQHTTIPIQIPRHCRYRNLNEQKCTIPLMKKIK